MALEFDYEFVVYGQIDDQLVVYPPDYEVYLERPEAAARVWRHLRNAETSEELLAGLTEGPLRDLVEFLLAQTECGATTVSVPVGEIRKLIPDPSVRAVEWLPAEVLAMGTVDETHGERRVFLPWARRSEIERALEQRFDVQLDDTLVSEAAGYGLPDDDQLDYEIVPRTVLRLVRRQGAEEIRQLGGRFEHHRENGLCCGPHLSVEVAVRSCPRLRLIGRDDGRVRIDSQGVDDVSLVEWLEWEPGAEAEINDWSWSRPTYSDSPVPDEMYEHPLYEDSVARLYWSFEGTPAVGFGNEGCATLDRLGRLYFWSDGDGNFCGDYVGRFDAEAEAIAVFESSCVGEASWLKLSRDKTHWWTHNEHGERIDLPEEDDGDEEETERPEPASRSRLSVPSDDLGACTGCGRLTPFSDLELVFATSPSDYFRLHGRMPDPDEVRVVLCPDCWEDDDEGERLVPAGGEGWEKDSDAHRWAPANDARQGD